MATTTMSAPSARITATIWAPASPTRSIATGSSRASTATNGWTPAFPATTTAPTSSSPDCAGSTELFAVQQLLEFGAHLRPEVIALQRISNIGGEKSDLRAAIEAAALELHP